MIYAIGKQKRRGFSLVETMVALVVMAIGMLGIVGLFVVSFKSGSTAINRVNAVNLAAELADRIRANRLAGAAYAGGSANNSCMGSSAKCSADEMAAYDLFGWRDALSHTLPGSPSATVTVTAGSGTTNNYTILIQWSEPNEPNLSYTLQTQI
jgi:type IV pilus assembly protein PilV